MIPFLQDACTTPAFMAESIQVLPTQGFLAEAGIMRPSVFGAFVGGTHVSAGSETNHKQKAKQTGVVFRRRKRELDSANVFESGYRSRGAKPSNARLILVSSEYQPGSTQLIADR